MSDPAAPRSPAQRALLARLAYLLGAAAIVVAIVLTRTPGGPAQPATLDIRTTSAGAQVDSPEITVTGVGEVSGTPDTLTVQMEVDSQATHATDALSQNESQTSSLIQTLTGAGVAQSDIQTASLSIYPTYGSSGQSITGYQVDEGISVTLHDLSTAGSVIDAAARSVGDDIRIDGMSLSISDTSSLMAQARSQAMGDAQAKAKQLAAGAGTTLGAIVSVTDSTTTTPTPVDYGGDVPAASAAVPVQSGSQQLSVSVTVVYQLAG